MIILKNLVLIACLLFCHPGNATEIKISVNEGILTLGDFLNACEEAANCTSSSRVQPDIPGKVISIKGTVYEVRYFSFEDTGSQMPAIMTFREYAAKNNLLAMKSTVMNVFNTIHFESFDYRRSGLKDSVYFSMAVRKIS